MVSKPKCRFAKARANGRALFDQLQTELGDLMFPLPITKRDAYARSALEGRPVWEMTGTAPREAAAEIRGVVEWIGRETGT